MNGRLGCLCVFTYAEFLIVGGSRLIRGFELLAHCVDFVVRLCVLCAGHVGGVRVGLAGEVRR